MICRGFVALYWNMSTWLLPSVPFVQFCLRTRTKGTETNTNVATFLLSCSVIWLFTSNCTVVVRIVVIYAWLYTRNAHMQRVKWLHCIFDEDVSEGGILGLWTSAKVWNEGYLNKCFDWRLNQSWIMWAAVWRGLELSCEVCTVGRFKYLLSILCLK